MTTHLRAKRVARGLSLTALAIEADVPVSTLSRIERGARCNQTTASRLAKALGLPPREVFVGYDSLRPF